MIATVQLPADPFGLIAAIGFVALGLAMIPLNEWLDRREERKHRG